MLDDKILREFKEAYKDITSDKSWVLTLLLCMLGGYLGLHRFYTRKNNTAIIQLILSISIIGLPISLIWAIYDFFQILYHGFNDSSNKMLDRNITRKSVVLLTFFLGYLGISNFYIKEYKKGLIKFLLFISGFGSFISIIWNLIDLHLICLAKKYPGLKNDFDTKKCLLLLLLSYFSVIIMFCYFYSSQTQNFNSVLYFIPNFIHNIWVGFITLIKNIINWILKMIFYCFCGIAAIAIIMGSDGKSSKSANKRNKSKNNKDTKETKKEYSTLNNNSTPKSSNEHYRYAIISYQWEGQIYSFKGEMVSKSRINPQTIWVRDLKGFSGQAKFLSIAEISSSDYRSSNLPDYKFDIDFYYAKRK